MVFTPVPLVLSSTGAITRRLRASPARFLGQFISLIAREHIPAKKAIESAHRLEFWHVIENHYLAKGWTRRDLEQHIKDLISDCYLRRGYAV